MKPIRIVVGLVVCGALLVAPWVGLKLRAGPAPAMAEANLAADLWHYWTGERHTLLLQFGKLTDVAVGDPVFVQDRPGSLHQVGEIQSLADREGKTLSYGYANVFAARALLYPNAPPVGVNVRVEYHTTPDSFAWVVSTLLTPERKRQLAEQFRQTVDEHRDEIVKLLVPVMEKSLHELLDVLAQELPQAVAAHEKELESLGVKYRRELVDRQLVPLVKQEIFPLVRSKAEPEVRAVGHELWQRVSLWRFGWRAAYDKLPFTEGTRTDKEWERFLKEEALPIVERHSEKFVSVVGDVLTDVVHNAKVQDAARKTLAAVAEDPEFERVIRKILDEAIVHNARIRQTVERQWRGGEVQAAIELATSRLEPAIRSMTDVLIGSPDTGVTPEFSRVLRSQILAKDRRWFLLDVSKPSGDTKPAEKADVQVPAP